MQKGETEIENICGILHDVIQDSNRTFEAQYNTETISIIDSRLEAKKFAEQFLKIKLELNRNKNPYASQPHTTYPVPLGLSSHTHWQVAQSKRLTKACQRACLPEHSADCNIIIKIESATPKI